MASGVVDASVQLEKIAAANGSSIAHAILNVPATLNSLTREMVEGLLEILNDSAQDDSVACVVISGSGEKAFCAGGDVHMLRDSALANPGGPCTDAEQFFAREYRMNYTLHTYAKPVLVWGDGIVMGGGLGVFAAGSHRVVTQTSRFAMPEITIALFPDVGGSYFLNQMPGQAGRFLALTGASFNAADALYTGLADHFVARESFAALIDQLQQLPLISNESLTALLRDLQVDAESQIPLGNVESHQVIIDKLCEHSELAQTYAAIAAWQGDDKWMNKARDGLLHGSPLAALWIDAQLQRSAGKPLHEVFESELVLATNIVRHSEFAEGVRALLVDKDRSPKWQYAHIDDVPQALLERFFAPPWPQNPLADLLLN